MNFGTKIKRIRMYHGLTQEELADRCELTKSYISQLEHDKTSPSLETLESILEVLGTNFKEFFSEEEDSRIVFKEDDQYVKEELNHKITWLVPTSQKLEMEPILVEIEPNGKTFEDTPHAGEEFGYVLEGSVEVYHGGKLVTVKKGESFYFETDKVHYLINKSKSKIAKVLWVSCPPNF